MAMFLGTPPAVRAACWAGNGGSLSFIDLDARAIGHVPNRWIGRAPARALEKR
jgi:hypothetical protein